MKKILFVTTRNPFSKNYSGDRLRASKIIKYLSKKNKVDLVYLDKPFNEEILEKEFNGNKFFFKYNFFFRIYNAVLEFLNTNPLQVGFFYSNEAHKFIKDNHYNYEVIIFHLLRSTKHLPSDFRGKKILEMTDIYSDNYKQTLKRVFFLNPLFYLYFFESLLIKKYEKNCSSIFDKLVLVGNNRINQSKHISNKKIVKINNGCVLQKKKFKFNKNNYKILFIGNLKYLPNKIACFNFAKNILPKINKEFPGIEFHIVGEISFINKIILNNFKNVKVIGPKKNLENSIKKSICGVANLNIATGMQNKILTYMSFGVPSICSKESFNDSILKKNKEVLVYTSEKQLIDYIYKLKNNKSFSEKISNNGYKKIKKNFKWDLVLKKYNKII